MYSTIDCQVTKQENIYNTDKQNSTQRCVQTEQNDIHNLGLINECVNVPIDV